MARATLREESGKRVPLVQWSGPSAGASPRRGMGRDSMPMQHTGSPPSEPSQTTALSAPCQAAQRSNGATSWSSTARITGRMLKGRLRPGLVASSKISPTVR
jgi:hypothetical protein